MHELLLFGQVPASRHDQVLQILAGIAGMQPKTIVERHLIFKPRKSPGQKTIQVGASQGIQNQQAQALQGQLQGEMFYLRLVTDVDPSLLSNHSGDEDEAMSDESVPKSTQRAQDTRVSSNGADKLANGSTQTWSLRFYDLPEVTGKRPVTARMISSVEITDGDPMAFMNAFGYDYNMDYILEGHQLVHENVILLLHRILQFPLPVGSQPVAHVGDAPTGGHERGLQDYKSVLPVDPSGGYLLQASIRVKDGSKPESMTLGMNELKRLKDTMKGVVDLEIGDRLALDTRVR